MRAHLPGLIRQLNGLTANAGSGNVDSEGDTTHRAITARSAYHVDGTGIKIGVISDSDDYLEASQASGNLPADVSVLPGQSGRPGTGEGTAMMEIVHDIAPGAKVYFSTCGDTEAQMAANIIALHNAGCQIIVDDIAFFDESPFQDGVVAKAVDTVTAAGAYYFSSATNNGNYDSSESGVWEGEFTDSGIHYSDGIIHSFEDVFGTPVTEDTLSDGLGSGQEVNLFWSDPLGKSRNDYNLYAVDGANNVISASTNAQTGTQDPFEYLPSVADGESLVVVLHSGAAKFLHLDCGTQHGVLTNSTAGRTRGHNSVNAVGAYGVAATPASLNQYGNAAGPYPKPFSKSNGVEDFSSDGPREQFYDKNGAAVPNGGLILLKPDITAADGVTTSLNQATVGDGNETFAPFFGTSAAAPHAAALTGLLLSFNPSLTQAQVRSILTAHTVDILTTGWDQDSGYGILDAVNLLAAAPVPPTTLASLSLAPATVTGGQGNSIGSVTLTAAAPTGGAVVSLASSTSALTVPASVTVAAGAKTATFTATSKTVAAATTVTVTATYNNISKTGTVTVNPAAALSSLTVSPASVIGGSANAIGTVTLTKAAIAATAVTLTSGNTAVLTVPASVTVAAGATTAAFTATSHTVTAATIAKVTATLGASSKAVNVTVTPVPVTLTAMTVSPTSVIGGQANTTGTVTLSANATAATTITLTSSTGALSVPASVTIAAGAKTATFTATSHAVTANTVAKVTATLGGVSKAVNVSVTAAAPALSSVTLSPASVTGGSAVTGTVTLTAAPALNTAIALSSGNTAALTVPASVTVPAGATTAAFTATSKTVTAVVNVTVTATYKGIGKTATVAVKP